MAVRRKTVRAGFSDNGDAAVAADLTRSTGKIQLADTAFFMICGRIVLPV